MSDIHWMTSDEVIQINMWTVEQTGEAADPAEHLDRCEVEVGALAVPRRDELVDLVPSGLVTHGPNPTVTRFLTSR